MARGVGQRHGHAAAHRRGGGRWQRGRRARAPAARGHPPPARCRARAGAAGGPGRRAALAGAAGRPVQGPGAGRDEAALLQGLAPRLQAAGAPCTDWRAGAAAPASPAPARLLRDAAVQQALLQLLVDSQAGHDGLDAAAARRHVDSRLATLHEQAAHAGRHFDRLPEATQHRARKRVKRLRYLADVVAGLHDKPRVQARFAKPLAAAQDALGELQDISAALPLYRSATARLPEAWFAVGWLVAEHARAVHRSGKALRALGRAKPFW
ncbi:MAG: CHAD domain-containing protein [Burkholderiaceae bacterium]